MEGTGDPAKEANDADPPSATVDGGVVAAFPVADRAQSSGLICLTSVAARHGIRTTPEHLAHEHVVTGEPDLEAMARIARAIGLEARAAQISYAQLRTLGNVFPILAQLGNARYVVVTGVADSGGGVIVWDPGTHLQSLLAIDEEKFRAAWSGAVLYLKRKFDWRDESQPFGLRWFLPQILKEKSALRDVALAAVGFQVIALCVPIYFQLMVDKVVTHHSWATLYVLTGGVVIALAFESVLSFLRQYVLLFATTKVDIRLAVQVFAHVLRLPLSYFEHIATGITVRHVQQVDRIRQFLTGRVFLTLLDMAGLLVFLPILFGYSAKLTLIILLVTGLIAATVALVIGPLRRRLRRLYGAEGERQAMLVETLTGMRTVKSMAVEPFQKQKWNRQSAHVIDLNFQVGQLSAAAQAVIHFLDRMIVVLVVAVGATEVFAGQLTIGALVAIQMLAGRISGPLVQAASLLHDYQETMLSVRMLASVMNHPPERASQKTGVRPPLAGQLELDRVSFRYGPELPLALDRISLTVAPGAVVGVVGRSGSGKTTLTRLLQGLYPCQEGVLRIDGVDIREIDLAYLRRNIGMVLQDNVLFKGSVRDNIALGRPEASMDEIVRAARMAGATEFIEQLPQTYDTELEENGSNLSGGQRQRLAIARALLTQPRFLIFDEATSALDPETEGIFLDNLPKMAAGRTVIIVSHRLSTLVPCNAIVVLDGGRIIDAANHATLLSRCELYRRLWNQQNRAA